MADATLFPPIIDSTMPAFPYSSTNGTVQSNGICTITFSLSEFNSFDDISGILFTLVGQKTNRTELDVNTYPMAQVYLAKAAISYNLSTELYSFTIGDNIVLKNTYFQPDYYYKMQIRLVNTSATTLPTGGQPTAAWLNTNLNNLSEWSTVCIIKPIYYPTFNLSLNAVADLDDGTVTSTTITSPFLTVKGELQWNKISSDGTEYENTQQENDSLNSYQFRLDSNNETIWTSEIFYSEITSPLSIIQTLKKYIIDSEDSYKLFFRYKTIQGYSQDWEERFSFTTSAEIQSSSIEFSLNKEDAYIDLFLPAINPNSAVKTYLLRGTNLDKYSEWGILKEYYDNSSLEATAASDVTEDNFTSYWIISEGVYQRPIVYSSEETYYKVGHRFKDFSVQAGDFYQYMIATATTLYNETGVILADFEDMYLYAGDGLQLRIAYNQNISNYKIKVTDSTYDPIGSVYPIITRNGLLNYRTLGISGLISMRADENKIFLDEYGRTYNYGDSSYLVIGDGSVVELDDNDNLVESEYRKKTNKYPEGVSAKKVDSDFYKERRFRESVMKFLTDGKPKLLKTAPEGNIIVRLTDVSFSPNQTLGRRLYTFSATATQISDFNIISLNNYSLV